MDEQTERDLIATARAFAVAAHGDQRYGDAPYVVHLDAVFAVAEEAGLSLAHRLAAYLHDTVEDTDTPATTLADRFGSEVADLVMAVSGEGPNRSARTADTVAKLQAYPSAVDLKLSDRIANVEAALRNGKHKLVAMYRSEMPAYQAVFATFGRPQLRERLERAFASAS